MSALVSVSGLTLTVGAGGREIVSDVSVAPGEMVGIVGESGSGKTQAARAIRTPSPLKVAGGSILFEGVDVPRASAAVGCGARIGMVFQEPMTSLNPSMSIGRQLEEGLKHRDRLGAAERRERVLDMLARVGIRDPKAAVQAWPHEFSGGMRQRMMLASVMLLEPALLIADEPTTALDAVVQRDAGTDGGADPRASHGRADDQPRPAHGGAHTERMVVMQHGRVLEGATAAILERPAHPTRASCWAIAPAAGAVNREAPIVEVRNLVIDYAGRQRCSRAPAPSALHGIDLQVRPREVVVVRGVSARPRWAAPSPGCWRRRPARSCFAGGGGPRAASWRDYRLNSPDGVPGSVFSLDPRMTIGELVGGLRIGRPVRPGAWTRARSFEYAGRTISVAIARAGGGRPS